MSMWDAMTERERDAWLAEKAMGWHIGGAGLVQAGLILPAAWVDTHGEFQTWFKDWHPTTDLAAAMQLAERMREQGCWVTIRLRPDMLMANRRTTNKYYCEIENRRESWSLHANATTLLTAIAEAVYRALGGK